MPFFTLDQYTPLEDIKSQYRKLALIYHPDNKSTGSHEIFIKISKEYKEIIRTHRPKVRSNPWDGLTLYRVIPDNTKQIYVTTVPRGCCSYCDVMVVFMWNSIEFRIKLVKGTRFPLTIQITNIGRYYMPIDIRFREE